jgi:hypothetical protein
VEYTGSIQFTFQSPPDAFYVFQTIACELKLEWVFSIGPAQVHLNIMIFKILWRRSPINHMAGPSLVSAVNQLRCESFDAELRHMLSLFRRLRMDSEGFFR